MTVPLYSLLITAVGEYVKHYLEERKLILFSDAVPDDLAMYCAVHQGSELTAELSVGQIMKINETVYPVTAVGSVATANLKQLGHITLNFDGAVTAELPGMVHLCGEPPRNIQPGDRISFCI
ncbi:PTS glucitol/sorbitol transporter subunit IIA [Citrobacter rodentium]|jgi:Phosphotransferase system sorbitol-specific component IIA|uniref:PTS system, IIa component n=2 Tax=Citrobacter rodentium TaxID=67825 RepID=D2TTM6_CITRI|nr:PTS glucitol/sorbitol transporter subunit IIA [Citrobacter rodentium]KIQ52242.1 PTS fructose transporter subunit IIA [Citrobacter rodentium]QBY31226.1 PTS fructose transporter subunit IIA [Citrobacter rodentium]UHO31411.1 PTS glucitol/sorbitol transporter subunit IIA [Citrobacter rodentium NBRC 105723 = DSM 16636]CBG91729.1 putative PTS system, IIa component [Citrobacter rodentium ICC168]HAT8015776.1 PTS fructose transporter subunit IIA [Citrobacter rodentium NBRC 105723 = DSM 16636]